MSWLRRVTRSRYNYMFFFLLKHQLYETEIVGLIRDRGRTGQGMRARPTSLSTRLLSSDIYIYSLFVCCIALIYIVYLFAVSP